MNSRISEGMTPTTIDIPHKLGREAAKARIAARIGELNDHLPAFAEVSSRWTSEYRLELAIALLGQNVAASLDIEEQVVRVAVTLPPMLSMMSGVIESAVRAGGERLLLPDDSKRDDPPG